MRTLILIVFAVCCFGTIRAQEDALSYEDFADAVHFNSVTSDAFTSFVESFIEDAEKYGVDLSHVNGGHSSIDILFTDFKNLGDSEAEEFIGYSFGMGDDEMISIYIDIDTWLESSSIERTALMYHELAHDILDLDHVDDDTHLMSSEGDLADDYNTLEAQIRRVFKEHKAKR